MSGEFTATLLEKEMLTPMVGILKFSLNSELDFVPGQFCNIIIDAGARPFSMTSTPGGKEVEFYVKAYPDGEVSKHILKLEEGDEVAIKGPYGAFQLTDKDNKKYLIGAGSGVAPLVSMARHIEDGEALFLHGVSYTEEFGYLEELKEMEDESFTYVPTISRPDENKDWTGDTGRVEKHLALCHDTEAEAYVCGPPPMVDNVTKHLLEKGLSEDNIFMEKYY